jgi:hypothetical protein
MTFKSKFAAALLIIGTAAVASSGTYSIAQESPSPAGAKVYFLNIKDGDTVSNPVVIRFGLTGMGVAPAGLQGEATVGTGHHHLLINKDLTGEALKEVRDVNNVTSRNTHTSARSCGLDAYSSRSPCDV